MRKEGSSIFLFDYIKKIVKKEYGIDIFITLERLDKENPARYIAKTRTIQINRKIPEMSPKEFYYNVILHELAHCGYLSLGKHEASVTLREMYSAEKESEKYINLIKESYPEETSYHDKLFFIEFRRLKRKYTYQKLLAEWSKKINKKEANEKDA